MTNFQKYKHEARRAEQRSDWTRAIDLYQRALDADEDMADLSLYNRIGDLHLRLGQNDAAVDCYESAVERYADHGMHTSAIALCNKLLRIAPGRTAVYRRLSGLHARTGLVAEGRSNCLTYVRQSLDAGQPSDAADAVEEFVEESGDEDIRLRYSEELAQRGDTDGAAQQLRIVYRIRRKRGSDATELRERIEDLQPEGPSPEAEVEPAPSAASDAPPAEAVNLARLVSESLAVVGEAPAFEVEPPPEGARQARSADDGLSEVRRVLERFREQVRDVLEGGDLSLRYDLGVEFMTIGLLDEAIQEFQAAVADPGLIEAANARIGECLALRTSGGSFEAMRRAAPAVGQAAPTFQLAPDAPESPDTVDEESPTAATEDVATSTDAVAAPEAGDSAPEPDVEQAPDETSPEEDELQGHFFRARLAQYRIRQAEERHTIDHGAHLDLGNAYIEMSLHQEAVRELSVVLDGPRAVAALAARALSRLATGRETDPDLALDVLERLGTSEIDRVAETLGTQLAAAWGEDHTHAPRLETIRGSLSYAVDELPALEDMFPGMSDASPASAAPARSATEAPEATEPDTSAEVLFDPEDLDGLDELLAELDAPPPEAETELAAADPVAESVQAALDLAAEGAVDEAVDHLATIVEGLEDGKRTREALRVLDHLLELRPDDVAAHLRRTELALMVNDRRLLVAAFAGLGECLERQDSPKKARAAYGRILDFEPSNEGAKSAIARIDATELEREKEASSDREPSRETAAVEGEATESDDGDARSHYELGLAFRQMGMWDEAIRELRSALGGIADRLETLEALGECLVKAGRQAEAIDVLRDNLRGADEDEGQVGPLYYLGLALQGEGDDEGACEVFGRVEAVSPGYRDTANRLSELSL